MVWCGTEFNKSTGKRRNISLNLEIQTNIRQLVREKDEFAKMNENETRQNQIWNHNPSKYSAAGFHKSRGNRC